MLSTDPEQSEAVEKLKDLIEELPLNHWTDKSIRDSVDQFILEHGKPPTSTDFKKDGLPPHTVIMRRYGSTLSQWLAENYPTIKPTREETTALYTRQFIDEFLRIRPSSGDAFNRDRSPEVKSWQAIATRNGVKAWSPLLKLLGLTVEPKHHAPHTFSVTVHNDYDFRD